MPESQRFACNSSGRTAVIYIESVPPVQALFVPARMLPPRQSLVNTFDHQLGRLFKAASRTRSETVPAISEAQEERVMTSWADSVAAEPGFLWMLPLLRRALALAYAVALAALVFRCYEPAQPAADEVAIVNSSVLLSYLP